MARDRTDGGGEARRGAGDPASPDDALRRLGDRLEQASDAAERLVAQAADEAAARIGGRLKPPPSGWQAPEEGPPAPPGADVALLLESLRDLIPADLERRLAEALRELLLAVRALIDWYLERLDRRRSEPVQVEDIPVR
jgi:hypothetical protein